MTTAEASALKQQFDPVQECLTPEVAARIADLRAPANVQARLDELAEKNAEGLLTPKEAADYDALVSTGALIAVLQAKARTASV